MITLLSALIPGLQSHSLEYSLMTGDPGKGGIIINQIDSGTIIPWNDTTWIYLEVRNQNNAPFVLARAGWYDGFFRAFDEHLQQVPKSGNSIHFESGEYQRIFICYLPVNDVGSRTVRFEYHTESDFQHAFSLNSQVQASFSTILLFLGLLGLIFFLLSRQIVYLHYSTYVFSITLFISYIYGYLSQLLPTFENVQPIGFWIFSNTITLSYLLFLRSFLDLKDHSIPAFRLVTWAIWLKVGLLVFEPLCLILSVDVQHSVLYKSVILVVEMTLCVLVIYHVVRMKSTLGNIFIFGSVILVFSSIYDQLARLGSVPDIGSQYLVHAGVVLEIFVFNIGIGLRINFLNKERHQAKNKLIQQLQMNEALAYENKLQLEAKVVERTKDLNRKNHENEILLKEIHHRVKNNLQMVCSLLNMQTRRSQMEDKPHIQQTINRIKSIGLIHEQLYQYDHLSAVQLDIYVRNLIEMILASWRVNEGVYDIEFEVDEMESDIEKSISLGMIIHELVTNSLKYAKPKTGNLKIRVEMRKSEGFIKLNFYDNGVQNGAFEKGFGWSIIEASVDSLEAHLSLNHSEGLQISIDVPVSDVSVEGK